MPLVSMTGFGRGMASDATVGVSVEVSSVNRKQFDLALTLPHALQPWEARVQRLVRERIRRGHVVMAVRLTAGSTDAPPEEMFRMAAAQIGHLRAIAARLGLSDDLTASSLLRLPESVLQEDDCAFSEAQEALLEQAVMEALDALGAMRQREGAALESDLRAHLERLRAMVAPVRERAPLVPIAHREAMLRRLAESGLALNAEDPAVLREIAVYADRCDISEEMARLESHFEQAEALFAGTEPCGRALDFLCQEFHREINTLGTKASDASISAIVVRFKSELEAFREQVQNIE